nr:hypothetical protein CFP56_41142 [Quercus suber]
MDSRNYSSFTDVLRGNVSLEDELFGVSETSPLLVEDSSMNDEAKIEAKNESGTMAHDKIEKARDLFKEIPSYLFQFEHCWLILKDFPKWASTMPREDSRKEMPQTPDSIDQGGGVDGIMDFERPIDRLGLGQALDELSGTSKQISFEERHGFAFSFGFADHCLVSARQ